MKKRIHLFSSFPFPLRLIMLFTFTSLISLAMSLYLNRNIDQALSEINSIYTSNETLNQVSSSLSKVHENIHEYLETRGTDALNQYYYYEQEYRDLLSSFNDKTTSSMSGSMEKNIRNISQTYLQSTNEAIEAKRARNTSRYRTAYADASRYFEFLNSYIYSLNNEQFATNSQNYRNLETSLRYLSRINTLVIIAIALFNIFLTVIMVHQITKPLLALASVSNTVAKGDFEVELPPVTTEDEIGTVTKAFNQMIISIRRYIEQVRSSMIAEKEAQERELLMETHLKEAQLRYYQAQINPHFLFNSLNAGAQLAMMEDAERTYSFVQNMADFFRYSLKSHQTEVDLEEEIALVENYVSIMNVRFAGDIHYEKEITCDISNIRVPCMILQPLVENAISYGIRNISWEGKVQLLVYEYENYIHIRVIDNGIGIPADRLADIRQGKNLTDSSDKSSNGIGLGNVQERLRLYYKEEDLFIIESDGENLGTSVTIRIPLQNEV